MSEHQLRLAGLAVSGELDHPPRATGTTGGGTVRVRRTRPGRGKLRVLVVDDSRDAADSLALLATIWGHDARPAYDGATAFHRAVARPPDVVLMDIGMPRMDGFRLAGLFRRHPLLADTLLVAVTGYADEPHRRLSAALFDHYLVKPVEPTTVGRLLLAEQVRRAAATAAVDPPLWHTARAPAGRRTRRPLPSEVISVE